MFGLIGEKVYILDGRKFVRGAKRNEMSLHARGGNEHGKELREARIRNRIITARMA